MSTQPTTKKESVARYQELYEEHQEIMVSCEQSEIERCQEIATEMSALDRQFPGTLEACN